MNFKQLFHFALVGSLGFVVDVGTLFGLYFLGFGYYSGRLISFICAATCTWLMNRNLVFTKNNELTLTQELTRYYSSMAFGGLINYSVYSITILLSPKVPLTMLLGVALGSLSGLLVNYTLAKKIVYQVD